MKRYFDHIQSKEPHEQRQHAMRVAGVVTAGVFAVWITTLGFRLALHEAEVAAGNDAYQASLTAATSQSIFGEENRLIVSTTTGY